MSRLRRFIAPFTAVWLVLQIAGVAAESVTWAVSGDAIECTCGHGDHAICPMHHHPTLRPGRCAVRAADTAELVDVASLLMAPAIVTSDTGAAPRSPVAPATRVDTDAVLSGHARTLSPPPRA